MQEELRKKMKLIEAELKNLNEMNYNMEKTMISIQTENMRQKNDLVSTRQSLEQNIAQTKESLLKQIKILNKEVFEN